MMSHCKTSITFKGNLKKSYQNVNEFRIKRIQNDRVKRFDYEINILYINEEFPRVFFHKI